MKKSNNPCEPSGVPAIECPSLKNLREKEQEILRMKRIVDDLAHALSHNLRGPLSTALGLIELIRTESKGPELDPYLGYLQQCMTEMDLAIHHASQHLQS